MEYVYHMIPKEMVGKKLMALNKLKLKDRGLYERYMKKYYDHPERPRLLEKQVPKLDCLWNDVIHLLPLHPSHVYQALTELRVSVKHDLNFYKIPFTQLAANQNVIYLYRKRYYQGPAAKINEKEIKWIQHISEYQALTSIPKDTLTYFEKEHAKGNRFGMFHFIPHILSLGEIDTENADIINWNE
ncbi:group-specific protein [Virgibacillus oceani]